MKLKQPKRNKIKVYNIHINRKSQFVFRAQDLLSLSLSHYHYHWLVNENRGDFQSVLLLRERQWSDLKQN